jgi:hypothetical protein
MGVNVHIYVQSPMPTLYHNPENLQEIDPETDKKICIRSVIYQGQAEEVSCQPEVSIIITNSFPERIVTAKGPRAL